MIKYAIRLDNQPIWTINGIEELFDTEELAVQAINEEIVICEEAVALGYLEDAGDYQDYRIVEVRA